jgi:hypothetical protein
MNRRDSEGSFPLAGRAYGPCTRTARWARGR